MLNDAASFTSFTSDSPLDDETEVFPDRRAFAKQVSKAILNWRGRESCVVALNGAWGSGKTTVKNLILKELQGQSPPVPILEFNPWQWNGSEQLWEGFLAELGEKLTQGINAESKGIEGAAQAEERKKKATTGWRRFSLLLTGVAGLTRASKMSLLLHGIDPQTVDAAAASLDATAALAKGASEDKSAEAVEPDKPLNEIKRGLSDIFRELEQPILVVMDDLDRLAPTELKEIIQLIKANADFPNVIYLLLFQRETVEKNLQAALQIDGERYLEKIVQVPLDIPATRPSEIKVQVEQHLQSVMGARWQEVISNPRWRLFYTQNLMVFFRTMRDVTRFFSSFSFLSAGILQEVDPIDFLALELLRFFEKDVYQAIAASPSLFISPPPPNAEPLFTVAKRQALDLLEKTTEMRRGTVKQILVMLFPQTSPLYEAASLSTGDSPYARHRDLRVCVSTFFDRYFIYAVPPEDVSRDEVVLFLESKASYSEAVQRLQQERERGLLGPFLSHLIPAIQGRTIPDAASLFRALFDEGEQEYRSGGKMGDADMSIYRAVAFYLLQKQPDGLQMVREAMENASACYLPIYVLETLQSGTAWVGLGNPPPASGVDWHLLSQMCAAKIAEIAQNGSLPDHSKFHYLLRFWRKWDTAAAVAYLEEWLPTPEFALSLARPYWNNFHGVSGLDSLETVVPIPMLVAHLGALDQNTLSEADIALVQAFQSLTGAEETQA